MKYCMELLAREYSEDLKRLEAELPRWTVSPACGSMRPSGWPRRSMAALSGTLDLEPEEEANIGRYFQEEYGADFVFVTHYPSKKRPFYAMDDPEDPRCTLSFDLLFRGMEVTTGGQRVHDYQAQVAKMEAGGCTRRSSGTSSPSTSTACRPTAAWASAWSG